DRGGGRRRAAGDGAHLRPARRRLGGAPGRPARGLPAHLPRRVGAGAGGGARPAAHRRPRRRGHHGPPGHGRRRPRPALTPAGAVPARSCQGGGLRWGRALGAAARPAARLQRVGPATARTLADELEVSERTVYRDVAILQAAGVPLWTEAGPGGGIRLLDGWRSPVDGFTAAETVALTIGSAGAADLGLGAVLAAARSKLRSALPAAARDDLARVTERFLLDAPAWFHRDDPGEVLPTVADAVWQGRRLDIRYGRRGHGVRRRVDPLGLVLKAGTWYLVAAHRRRPRTWRVSRITSATPRPEPAWRPPGFDLARWWSASAAAFDASIRPLRARLRLSPAAARRLPRLVPGELTVPAL